MHPSLYAKIIATGLALVTAGAAAAGAIGSPPDTTEDEVVEELTDVEAPEDEVVDVVVVDEDEAIDEADEAEDADEASEESDELGEPKDNHGAYVSAVAKDDSLTGREHGEAVSEVARSDAGKPHADDEAEAPEDTDEAETTSQSRGNGKGHGKP